MKKMSIAAYISILYLLFVITGFKTSDTNAVFSMITVLVLFGMFIKSGMALPDMLVRDNGGKLLMIFLILCYMVISVTQSSQFDYTLSRLNLFFPIIMFLYFKNDKESIKPLIWITLIIWGIISVRAVVLYSTEAVSARDMASGLVEENVMTGGGYGFAIGSAILAVYLLEMLLWKRIKANILNVTFIVLLCAVVFFTQSTITIIALFFGILFGCILRMFRVSSFKRMGVRHILLIVFVVLAIVVLILVKDQLGQYIIDASKGSDNIVMTRLKEVGNLLVHGSESGSYQSSDMADRMGRLSGSFDIFLDNPLFGAIPKYGANYYNLQEIGIGSHGELFDSLGRYGIILSIPYLGMFFYSMYRERKMQKASIGMGYIVSIMIMMIFNPFLFSQSNLILFFVVPMLTYLYNYQENGEVNEDNGGERVK